MEIVAYICFRNTERQIRWN